MKAIQTDEMSVDDIESYRRLVELQKQIIEVAQQNEYTKLACTQLRERVASEVLSRPQAGRISRQKPVEILIEPPISPAKPDLMSLVTREQPTC
jgi:regulator of replication initiation timing